MPKRDEEKYNIIVKGEPKEVTEIRQKILTSFNDLVFVEDGHKYFLNGEEYMSVSSVTDMFDEPFDNVAKATAYAEKNGETPQYWLDKWRYANLKATITGTQVHSYAESMSWIKAGHPENITDDNKYKYIADKGWLIPTRRKEEAALKFWEDFPEGLHIVLPETRVYSGVNPNLPKFRINFAGTFDLLLYYKHPTDDTKSGLVLTDWKTNGSLTKEYSRKSRKMLYPPFDRYYSEPLGHYTIQQSAYQIPLEDIGLKVIGRRLVWLKEDGNYEIIKLDNVTNELRGTLI